MNRALTEFIPRTASGLGPKNNNEPVDVRTLPRWVLLRGLVREQRHWGDFGQRLADHLQVRVLCPDLPGNGQLYRQQSPVRLIDLVKHLRLELRPSPAAQTDTPLRLLGLSMGAMVATEWALRYPEEIGSLVLINGSMGDLSPPWQRLRPSALACIARALMLDTAGREALIYRLSCHRNTDATLAHWLTYARDCPVSRSNLLRQLGAASCYRSGRRVPATPALILCSRNDALVNPTCSAAIANYWRAPLAIHEAAGHDLPHDDPDWVLAQITRWRLSD
ncbi:alpha/beta fold hydrolase [Marinobacterium sedimentorum]|uniref:alpha/beta fold hydrolase n=1 Tax=Marinobacterium sedimentorum TaxID=2927804 RepID=UPI0020C69641|nr:alpha/beta hydrolase [Marinobacterium sedimentorum]MCP8690455.1 alpha/beta hydrolase [Marinobacterium sedimentorum]